MTDETTKPCPDCGSAIPPDAPGGLCPKCLLREGLDSSTPTLGVGGQFVPPEPEDLADRFPHLEILELIGRGGMGAVYKARQRKLDRLVALKILTPEAARPVGFSERFAREARTLARLNHANIVAIYDFGEAEGTFYFLMEFVDGANLREVLSDGSLSPKAALAIVPQVCAALQFAHEEGVVHRDIKPENILLDRKGNVKIADFGLAKLVQQEVDHRTLTIPGQVMGTPAYMAPEQIEHPTEVDHRADIFSLGVVFYEMLTGELPLGRFPVPSSKVQIDVRLDDVVLRTLEKEPARRYQHASDVGADVSSIQVGPAAAPAPTPPERPRPVTAGAPSPPPRMGAAGTPPPPAGAAGAPPPPSSAGAPTPPPPAAGPPTRRVQVVRPRGFTLLAIWSFLMAAFYFDPSGSGTILPSLRHAGTAIGVLGAIAFFLVMAVRWVLAAWQVVVGIGILRVQAWARSQAIALAAIGCLLFPVGTLFSILALIFLLRKDVARVFDLGEGPVHLEEEAAVEVEQLMRSRRRRRKSKAKEKEKGASA